MTKISLKFPYKVDGSLIMSIQDFKDIYFFGIALKNTDGTPMKDSALEYYLRQSMERVEELLEIKIRRQVIEVDTKDFVYDEYKHWGLIRTTYPVVKPISLEGYYSSYKQIKYPQDWLSVRQTSDKKTYQRLVNIIPASGSVQTSQAFYSGIIPFAGIGNNSHIPNYWKLKYETGFNRVPTDLVDFIGKYASLHVFNIMGDIILGAGIASQSISLDGLSQSIASTASATNGGYASRILTYLKELIPERDRLINYYRGINFSTL